MYQFALSRFYRFVLLKMASLHFANIEVLVLEISINRILIKFGLVKQLMKSASKLWKVIFIFIANNVLYSLLDPQRLISNMVNIRFF